MEGLGVTRAKRFEHVQAGHTVAKRTVKRLGVHIVGKDVERDA